MLQSVVFSGSIAGANLELIPIQLWSKISQMLVQIVATLWNIACIDLFQFIDFQLATSDLFTGCIVISYIVSNYVTHKN